MTSDFLFIYIILIHFLADFGLQTTDQAMNKSTDVKYLLYHVLVYSLVWFIAVLALREYIGFTGLDCIMFSSFTFGCHFFTDFITSRIGKPFWEKKDLHNGFVVIGFDQMLHYLQLYFTFKLLA